MEIANKNILIVIAHPDDEAIGMGGTLCRLADNGNTIYMVQVFSHYDKDLHLQDERNDLITEMAPLLGVSAFYKFGFTSYKTPSHAIADELSRFRTQHRDNNITFDTVFSHTKHDINSDHRAVNEAVQVAFRDEQSDFFWFNSSIKSISTFQPNVFSPIEPRHMLTKREAVMTYTKDSLLLDKAMKLMEYHGSLCDSQYAEAFEAGRLTLS